MAKERITSIVNQKTISALEGVQKQLEIMRNCELELNKLGIEIKNFNIGFSNFPSIDFSKNV